MIIRKSAAEIEHDLLTSTYIPPEAGQMTVAAYATEWAARRHWRASTRDRVP